MFLCTNLYFIKMDLSFSWYDEYGDVCAIDTLEINDLGKIELYIGRFQFNMEPCALGSDSLCSLIMIHVYK